MSTFDSIWFLSACTNLKCEKGQDLPDVRGEIQVKAFGCRMNHYEIGDVIEEAPDGEIFLIGNWHCPYCKQAKSVVIHVYNGLLFGVYPSLLSEGRIFSIQDLQVDEQTIMQAMRTSAERGTSYRLALAKIFWYVVNTREAWGKKDQGILNIYPANQSELVDKILQLVRESDAVREAQ